MRIEQKQQTLVIASCLLLLTAFAMVLVLIQFDPDSKEGVASTKGKVATMSNNCKK